MNSLRASLEREKGENISRGISPQFKFNLITPFEGLFSQSINGWRQDEKKQESNKIALKYSYHYIEPK